MKITKVAEGAYFVPSYSVQTITNFQPSMTNQTIAMGQDDRIPTNILDAGLIASDDFENSIEIPDTLAKLNAAQTVDLVPDENPIQSQS